jgi:hypothetical protein
MNNLNDKISSAVGGVYSLAGGLCAVPVVIGVFLYGWWYAIDSWGWLLGLAFGWIPAGIVAVMAGWVAFWLGPVLLIIAVVWYLNQNQVQP